LTFGKMGGWLGRVGASAVEVTSGSPLPEIAIDYDKDGMGAIGLDLVIGSTPVSCTIYEPGYISQLLPPGLGERKAPAETTRPSLLAPLLPSVDQVDHRITEWERVPRQRVWRVIPAAMQPRAPAWVIGSLVHGALAAWRFPDDSAAAGGQHSFERWVIARARGYGITDREELADAVRQTRRLLRRFRAHPLYGEMAGADRRLHEVPYSLVVDGRTESGILDTLYLQHGVWTVVEVKTDRVRDSAELEELLAKEEYLAQTQRYQAAVEQLTGQRPRALLCLLRSAGRVHVHQLSPG
jgi:hypothetical protein